MKQNISQLLEYGKYKCGRFWEYGELEWCNHLTIGEIPSRDPELCLSVLIYDQGKLLVRKGMFQPKSSSYYHSLLNGSSLSNIWKPKEIPKDSTFSFVSSFFRKATVKKVWSISGVSAWHRMKSKRKEERGKLAEHWECPQILFTFLWSLMSCRYNARYTHYSNFNFT